jgi:hypothetical protein
MEKSNCTKKEPTKTSQIFTSTEVISEPTVLTDRIVDIISLSVNEKSYVLEETREDISTENVAGKMFMEAATEVTVNKPETKRSVYEFVCVALSSSEAKTMADESLLECRLTNYENCDDCVFIIDKKELGNGLRP